MKHNLQISVSKKPKYGVLKFLLGSPTKLTILVPGDSVEQLSINEVPGGETYETV